MTTLSDSKSCTLGTVIGGLHIATNTTVNILLRPEEITVKQFSQAEFFNFLRFTWIRNSEISSKGGFSHIFGDFLSLENAYAPNGPAIRVTYSNNLCTFPCFCTFHFSELQEQLHPWRHLYLFLERLIRDFIFIISTQRR